MIPLGITNKEGKKLRPYRHCSNQPHTEIHPINTLTNVNLSEPRIGYGTTLQEHCSYLWKIAATFSNCIIDFYDNDVSGAFPQIMFYLDIARANTSIYGNKMIVSTALHFGGNFGPTSWEPRARARCHVAQWLFKSTSYQIKFNKEAIDNNNDDKDKCTIVPELDEFNQGVLDENGNFTP